MPYKSAKQRAFMHERHPEIAARWDRETGGKVDEKHPEVPERKTSKKKKKGK